MRLLPLALLTVLAFVVVSCGAKSDTSAPEENNPEPSSASSPSPTPPPSPAPESVPEPVSELEALKPFGSVFQSSEGIEKSFAPANLSEGRIKRSLLLVLRRTTTLTGLNFQFAPEFSDEGLAELGSFANLRKLYLPGTRITDAGLAHIKGLKKLEEVMLSKTAVTDAGLANLKGMTELREIDLGDSYAHPQDITDAGLAQLPRAKLARVQVSHTKITDAGLALLKDSKRITVLWADGCEITDKGLSHLKPHSQLMWLKLNYTQITDDGLEHLAGLSNLTALEIDGTKVTQYAAEKLQKKLPKCTIKGKGFELAAK